MQVDIEVRWAMKHPRRSRTIGRREFIKSGALAGLGVGLATLASPVSAAIPPTPQVRRYARGAERCDVVGKGEVSLLGDQEAFNVDAGRGRAFSSAEDLAVGGLV